VNDQMCALAEQGIKEVVLLGQNVNSYLDHSTPTQLGANYVAPALADGFRSRKKSTARTRGAGAGTWHRERE